MQPILEWNDYDQYKKFKQPKALPLKQWAWEFLRRQRDYQKDYERYALQAAELEKSYGPEWKTNPEAKSYFPPKKPDESDKHWLVWSRNPHREHLHKEMGRKWYLSDMYAPQLEWTDVKFIKPTHDPKVITSSEEFADLMEEYPIGVDGAQGVHEEVGGQYGVVVFDLTTDIVPQLGKAGKILSAYRRKMKAQKRIRTIDGKTNDKVWLRHLQVLDALLTTPRPSNTEIGEFIGYELDEKPSEVGSAYVRDARDVNYQKILKKAWDERAKTKP